MALILIFQSLLTLSIQNTILLEQNFLTIHAPAYLCAVTNHFAEIEL